MQLFVLTGLLVSTDRFISEESARTTRRLPTASSVMKKMWP